MTNSADPTAHRRDDLWPAVDALLARASPEGVRAHALGPLEARRRDRVGSSVPEVLAVEARVTAFAMLSVRPLLRRAREGCEGPLVLMKGPELALRYPDGARSFTDLDLLAPEPRRAHDQLRAAGFVEDEDPTFAQPRHHLRPLRWPELPLKVEIHGHPKWPDGLEAPATASIVAEAGPTGLDVDGILAPADVHHALLVAAHAWAHEPLWRLRDLVDARALVAPSDRTAVERQARDWGITRLWRTTDDVTDAVLGRRRMPPLIRPWARHLSETRERTVLEDHLRDLLAEFWALPVSAALTRSAQAIRDDLLPAPGQRWSAKLSRMVTASRNAKTPMSQHSFQVKSAAARGVDGKAGQNDAAAPCDELD